MTEMKDPRVYVSGLSSTTTEDDLKEYFSTFGTVLNALVVRRLTSEGLVSRGFGFVTFVTHESAVHCLSSVRRHQVGGKTVLVTPYKELKNPKSGMSGTGGSVSHVKPGGSSQASNVLKIRDWTSLSTANPTSAMCLLEGNKSGAVLPSVSSSPSALLSPVSGGAGENRVLVGCLDPILTDETSLRDYFSRFGEVVEVSISRCPTTFRSHGLGHVTFRTREAMDACLQRPGSHCIDGQCVTIIKTVGDGGTNSSNNNTAFEQQWQIAKGVDKNAVVVAKREVAKVETSGSGASAADVSSSGRLSTSSFSPPSDNKLLRRLFVGRLGPSTTEAELRTYFERFGPVEEATVMRHPESRTSRGFGFVTFMTAGQVDECQANRPHELAGRAVETRRVLPREFNANHASASEPESRKLFVGGLSDQTTEDDIRRYFWNLCHPHQVVSVDLIVDQVSGRKRGFGFVELSDSDLVDKICLIGLLGGGHMLGDICLDVRRARTKQESDAFKHKKLGTVAVPPAPHSAPEVPVPKPGVQPNQGMELGHHHYQPCLPPLYHPPVPQAQHPPMSQHPPHAPPVYVGHPPISSGSDFYSVSGSIIPKDMGAPAPHQPYDLLEPDTRQRNMSTMFASLFRNMMATSMMSMMNSVMTANSGYPPTPGQSPSIPLPNNAGHPAQSNMFDFPNSGRASSVPPPPPCLPYNGPLYGQQGHVYHSHPAIDSGEQKPTGVAANYPHYDHHTSGPPTPLPTPVPERSWEPAGGASSFMSKPAVSSAVITDITYSTSSKPMAYVDKNLSATVTSHAAVHAQQRNPHQINVSGTPHTITSKSYSALDSQPPRQAMESSPSSSGVANAASDQIGQPSILSDPDFLPKIEAVMANYQMDNEVLQLSSSHHEPASSQASGKEACRQKEAASSAPAAKLSKVSKCRVAVVSHGGPVPMPVPAPQISLSAWSQGVEGETEEKTRKAGSSSRAEAAMPYKKSSSSSSRSSRSSSKTASKKSK